MFPVMETPDLTVTRVVAANVRAELARREKRQADLAAATGWSQQKVSNLLKAKRQWGVDEVNAVARYLGVTPNSLTRDGVAA